MLTTCSYHELSNYTNIYSLSTFDTSNSAGCIISSNKHLYRLWCKHGTVQIRPITLSNVQCTLYLADLEILANSSHFSDGFLTIALAVKNSRSSYAINIYMRRAEDFQFEHSYSHEIDLVPSQIFLVNPN